MSNEKTTTFFSSRNKLQHHARFLYCLHSLGSSNDTFIRSFPNMLISGLALSSVCKLHVSRWSVCKGSWESPTVVVRKKL